MDDNEMAVYFNVNITTEYDEIHEESTTKNSYSYNCCNYIWM